MDALDADSGMGRMTDENVRAETSSDCSSFHSSRHGAIPFNTTATSLPDDFIDMDMSKINDEINKLRWQCIYLEQIRAQKSIVESSVKVPVTNEHNAKPVPRMGTKIPPRSNQIPPIPSVSKESPTPLKSDQSNRPILTFILPQDDSSRSFPPVLRYSNFPSDPETPIQVKEETFPIPINDSSSSQDKTVLSQNATPAQNPDLDRQMQWVMKKRSDGSKYLVKRPIRYTSRFSIVILEFINPLLEINFSKSEQDS